VSANAEAKQREDGLIFSTAFVLADRGARSACTGVPSVHRAAGPVKHPPESPPTDHSRPELQRAFFHSGGAGRTQPHTGWRTPTRRWLRSEAAALDEDARFLATDGSVAKAAVMRLGHMPLHSVATPPRSRNPHRRHDLSLARPAVPSTKRARREYLAGTDQSRPRTQFPARDQDLDTQIRTIARARFSIARDSVSTRPTNESASRCPRDRDCTRSTTCEARALPSRACCPSPCRLCCTRHRPSQSTAAPCQYAAPGDIIGPRSVDGRPSAPPSDPGYAAPGRLAIARPPAHEVRRRPAPSRSGLPAEGRLAAVARSAGSVLVT
jgi:hypothetical protein